MKDSNTNQNQNCVLTSPALRQLLGPDVMKLLRCGICTDFFQVPIVLPCGHTFCLHCLTQMCIHANLKQAPASINDVRIGCPSCHVPIYATPILRKNVTCNFILQSLIECLKLRKDTTPNMQHEEINTESERPVSNDGLPKNIMQSIAPTLSSSCKLATTTPEQQLATSHLLSQFDHVTRLLETSRPSIVDLAFMEVEEIRNEHLQREKQRQANRDAKTRDQVRAVQNIMKKSREEQQKSLHHHDHQPPQQRQLQNRQILMRLQHPQQNQYNKTDNNNNEEGQKLGLENAEPKQKLSFPQHSILQNTANPDGNDTPNANLICCNQLQPKNEPQTISNRLPLKHPYSCNMHQQQTQSSHTWGKTRNCNQTQPLQHQSRLSVQEPPQKCRKIAVTSIETRAIGMEKNNTKFDQDYCRKNETSDKNIVGRNASNKSLSINSKGTKISR